MNLMNYGKGVNFRKTTELKHWLLLSASFSCLLFLIRVIATGSLSYLFLPWNLFLAFIPYAIVHWFKSNIAIVENKISLVGLLAVWMLFFPNSFYIITDLFHLSSFQTAPKWFDLLMIYSFAWNGVVLGIVSLSKMEKLLGVLWGKKFSVLIVFIVMLLAAFGVYIGRYLRFNSWDVITDPFSLLISITELFFNPIDNGYVWAMTTGYATFLTLLYFTIRKLSEPLQ